MRLRFKDHSENFKEFNDSKLDSRLHELLRIIYGLVSLKYGDVYFKVVEVYRTQKEQDTIYGHRIDYKTKPWRSVHQEWRGLDIVIENKDGTNRNDIMEWATDALNEIIQYQDTQKHDTVVYHAIQGKGSEHMHIQVHWDTKQTKVLI